MASTATSSVRIKEKPVAIGVKRKASQRNLNAFWPALEVNARPLKKPFLDSEKISLSDHESVETLKTKRLLTQHMTVSIFESIEAILLSLVKFVRSAHFELLWKSKKQIIDSLLKTRHLYDVLRVNNEDEKQIKKKMEHTSPEDNAILFKYLPLLKEYVPSAVEEIESEIKAHVSSEGSDSVSTSNDTKDGYLYDPYTANVFTGNEEEISFDHPSVQVKDEDDSNDMPDSDYISEDSNAEDHPRNDYPDKSFEDYEADPFGDYECHNSNYEEEMTSKSKKDGEISNNGDEDMKAFSNSEYSHSEHDDENSLRLSDSDYNSEHSNAEDHPINDYPDKESLEDDKGNPSGDSECPNSNYKEEMASKSKKYEGTSNNGDENMEASSNSEYSDSEHDDENNLRLPSSDYDSEYSNGFSEDHPINDYPDKESLEDDKAVPSGDSECSNSNHKEEMSSKSKKYEGTSNNGDENIEAASNSEYSDSEHDDENNLRLPSSDYDSEYSNGLSEDHPRNDYLDKESLEDERADPSDVSGCSSSHYKEEMTSKSKKYEETSNNGDEDMESFSNSEYSKHDDENNLRLPDSDYDSEYSNVENHPRNDYPDKESSEDYKAGPSEFPSSNYKEEMTSRSKKCVETSNNGDEGMVALSNSDYSDSEHDDENNLRLPDSDYDSEYSSGFSEDHPRNDYPDKESLEDDKADPSGDSECLNSNYKEELASKEKKYEETSNNGDEEMDAFSNSEYSDSEHDDENNLRFSDSDYDSEYSNCFSEDHPRNDYPEKEHLKDDKADPSRDYECPDSDFEEEMASKSKKYEGTSDNGDEDMEAFSSSEYSNSEYSNSEYSFSEHGDEHKLELGISWKLR